jgi:hypothetical protein
MGAFIHGEAECECGANFLIADDMENTNLYWLNKKEMTVSSKESNGDIK